MKKYALGIQYDGTDFSGWQKQTKGRTVQATLEAGLGKFADQPTQVICAGRTDTGVHAANQVVHFITTSNRELQGWIRGTNSYLPDDVRVMWALEVPQSFHARYSAITRYYRYIIIDQPTRPALLRNYMTWQPYHLDVSAMHQAAQAWVGTHDFSSFRDSDCQSKSPIRDLNSFSIYRANNVVVFDILANAFLHHMVRNMVGTLLAIGRGDESVSWSTEVLVAKNRSCAGNTAPPNGLILLNVMYPAEYHIPDGAISPLFHI